MHAGLIREVSPISALLRRVSLIGGCAILLLTGNAFGQTGASGCATGTVLVPANGMFTNECDAWGNLMALQEQVVPRASTANWSVTRQTSRMTSPTTTTKRGTPNSRRSTSKRLGNVQVATPTSGVAAQGPYLTFADDLVMAAVQGVFPQTLPANLPAELPDRKRRQRRHYNHADLGEPAGR